jgi:hypothetical protein
LDQQLLDGVLASMLVLMLLGDALDVWLAQQSLVHPSVSAWAQKLLGDGLVFALVQRSSVFASVCCLVRDALDDVLASLLD